jgi:hypothetical protein
VSTEIVPYTPPSGPDLQARMTYAARLAEAGLLPRAYQGKPANVLYAIEYGAMIGLAPMAAITGLHVIEGKPTASSGLVSALVRRAGHILRVTGDDQRAEAVIVRADDPQFEFRAVWTLEWAKTAGLLGKGVWRTYPAAMLKARAITEVARDACEEALLGLHYTPEELGAEVDEDGRPMAAPAIAASRQRPGRPQGDEWTTPAPAADEPVDAEIVPDTHLVMSEVATSLADAIAVASAEELSQLAADIKRMVGSGELTGPERAALLAVYPQREAELAGTAGAS